MADPGVGAGADSGSKIIRFEEPYRSAVISLWTRSGLVRPWNDPDKDIDRCLSVASSALFLMVHGEALIGTAMTGYDGHRGSVYYLAIEPDDRGRGYGRCLMDRCEAYLREMGCPKVNLFVRADNSQVRAFYEDRGYQMETSASFGFRLIPDQ